MVVQLESADFRRARLGAKDICRILREQIEARIYPPNAALPSSRALAQELGVSRTTVTAAHEQLAAEGYIEIRQGARPRVAASAPVGQLQAIETALAPDTPVHLSGFGQRIMAQGVDLSGPKRDLLMNFRYGEMATRDFPISAWKKAVTNAMLRMPPVLAYGDPAGSLRLRKALQGYLWRARFLSCDLERIIIVNGSQQALDLTARLLLDVGDEFVIENPSYLLARQTFEGRGAQAFPVTVDHEGIDTAQFADRRAALAYVTPSHQYPQGAVMSMTRRMEILSWAHRTGSWVVEDDYDSEYRYDSKPLPPLKAFDNNGRVIYIGTVSKILSPGLRIGYVLVPEVLRPAFVAAKRLMDRHSSLNDQEALAELIESGAYERHMRRQRRKNHRRRDVLIAALERQFGPRVEIEGISAGLHVVVWIRELPRLREAELIARAQRLGLGLYSVHPHYDPPRMGERAAQIGLVMGYAALEPEWIVKGVATLRQLVDEMGAAPPDQALAGSRSAK